MLLDADGSAVCVVSILTGLERPVQREIRIAEVSAQEVSILTGLERPVQRGQPQGRRPCGQRFNPHRP